MEGSILSLIASFAPVDAPADSAPETCTASSGRVTQRAAQHAEDPRPRGVSETTQKHVVHLICFSKDRAFQLDQCLASASRHLLVEGSPTELSLRVSVLYVATGGVAAAKTTAATDTTGTTATPTATAAEIDHVQQRQKQPQRTAATTVHGGDQAEKEAQDMLESYNLVRRRHPAVVFVQEQPGLFCDQLVQLLKDEQEGEKNFVLFVVDDMFFYRDFDLSGAVGLLAKGESC